MLGWQYLYKYYVSSYNGDLDISDLANRITLACYFTSTSTFNLAHWFFALSYLALSYRLELTANKMP